MRRRTSAEILAEKIANRSTELHRAYDRASNEHTQTLMQINRLNDTLTRLERTMTQCRNRALEQGYPDLL